MPKRGSYRRTCVWGLVGAKGDYETISFHRIDEAGARDLSLYTKSLSSPLNCVTKSGGGLARQDPGGIPDPLLLEAGLLYPKRLSRKFSLLPVTPCLHSLTPDSLAPVPQCGSQSRHLRTGLALARWPS